jgi:predicted SprT family Zn-dependent metalloprotease
MKLEKAEILADKILKYFKKEGFITDEWQFQWSKAKSYLGYCNYNKKYISLSRFYVEIANKDQIKDTILHEIAHIIAGQKAGHGPQWKRACREITGAIPKPRNKQIKI